MYHKTKGSPLPQGHNDFWLVFLHSCFDDEEVESTERSEGTLWIAGKKSAIGVGCGNSEMGKFTVVSKGPERERRLWSRTR